MLSSRNPLFLVPEFCGVRFGLGRDWKTWSFLGEGTIRRLFCRHRGGGRCQEDGFVFLFPSKIFKGCHWISLLKACASVMFRELLPCYGSAEKRFCGLMTIYSCFVENEPIQDGFQQQAL